MKIGQFLKKMVGGSVVLATLACPVFTSCYDDSKLWVEIEDIKGQIESIEAKLNTDLAALKALLEGQIATLEGKVDGLVTVSEVTTLNNGVEITLSNGTKFTVYPAQDNKGLVTTLEMDDVLYWAVYDADGNAKLVTDAEGSPIPVVDVTPQVKVDEETSLVEISFDGGNTWETVGYGQPCVFSGAEVVYTDNYTDEEEAKNPNWCVEEPKYVVLTLPDGNTITLTVDGYGMCSFGYQDVQYMSAGTTMELSAYVAGIESWIKEVPTGWIITENAADVKYGSLKFNVTAPTAEAIASGAALAEADFKVVAILEGGKSVTASITLTTKEFKSLAVAKGNAYINMNYGLNGYILGVVPAGSYDEEAILADLKTTMDAEAEESWGTWSPWYSALPYFDTSVDGYSLSQLAGELTYGESYVMYAVALNCTYDEYDTPNYSLGAVVTVPFVHNNIEIETTSCTFNDIQIKATFTGVESFFGNFSEIMKGEEAPTMEEIVYDINSSLTSSWWGPTSYAVPEGGVYEGVANSLVESYQAIEPGKTYYLWLIPNTGSSSYSPEEVYYVEFTTEDLLSGGSINIEAPADSLVTVTYNKISVPLEAEGASYIYYAWVEPEMLPTIADYGAYLTSGKGDMTEGASAVANARNLTAGTAMTLLAMAVDENGCYGDILVKEYSSKAIEYADVTLSVEMIGTPCDTAVFKITPSGTVSQYVYYCQPESDFVWSYHIKTEDYASEYMFLNSLNHYKFTKLPAADLPADGLVCEGLTLGAPSVFIVAAVLEDGSFTKAVVKKFKPEINFGEFVYSTDDNGNENPDWAAKRPVVDYTVEMVGDFGNVAWTVSGLAEGFTAKTYIFHEDYLVSYPTDKDKAEYLLTNPGTVNEEDVVDGQTYRNYYASKGYVIAVIIKDAEGNYYAPYIYEIEGLGGGYAQ